jgi:copper chaperone CopZ
MRTLVLVMGIVSLLGFAASAQDNGQARGGSVTLKVSGMSCGACAARVEKAAKEIAGVTGAKVSQPKAMAEVTFDPAKISAESIADMG